MGKNHKHKKQLKSERGKTKLRVKNEKTKFLPKGLNVTKTDFKVKAIVLPEQLKAYNTNELLSKRKLNIKDILSRLKHYNVTVKHDCCEELKQILVYHLGEIIQQYLSQVLQGVSPLLLDKEKKVRRDAVKILDIILGNAPSDKIEPFFAILSSYLCCAMTNIDRTVQEDSLLFLDSLLKHVPKLVAKGCEKILPNLFALISKLRNDAKPGRTLTVNLGSKITNVKWRIQVLSRLYGFLEAVVDQQVLLKVDNDYKGEVKHAKNTSIIPIYYNPYMTNAITLNSDAKQLKSEESDVITKNLHILMSLLYEIWLEVAPGLDLKQIGSDTTLLNGDTAAILTCILSILYLLLEYTKNLENGNISNQMREEFFTRDLKHFLKSALSGFPYSQQTEKKRKEQSDVQKVLIIEADPKCLRENFLISYLFCTLNYNLNSPADIADSRNILNYINNCLSKRNYFGSAHIPYLTAVAKILLFDNFTIWKKSNIDMETFLGKLLLAFGNIENHFNQELFNTLCKVIEVPELNRSESYQDWLGKLPKLLCRNRISINMLDILLLIAKQNNERFLVSLTEDIFSILDNFKTIKIDNCADQSLAKLKILYLYYYVNETLNSEATDCLMNFATRCGEKYEPFVEYILSKV